MDGSGSDETFPSSFSGTRSCGRFRAIWVLGDGSEIASLSSFDVLDDTEWLLIMAVGSLFLAIN